jgi:D-aminopeptidase
LQQGTNKRLRELGFSPGMLPTGKRNKISDVPGVTVGHCTRIEGEDIRTGITIIDPGVADLFHNKLPAAVAVGNGFGKLMGATQIDEMGTLETPIALTNTLAVGIVAHGLLQLVIRNTPKLAPAATINAVVGETNDGTVNDVHNIVLTPADVAAAYEARTADFALGSIGGGAGTSAFSWKGGVGSASRIVQFGKQRYTLGALVQTNFGGALTIMGVPVGRLLGKTDFDKFLPTESDGSCMMILATDAPLSSRQLGRIARRAMVGLARTGSILGTTSGDYAIAFSTNRAGVEGSGPADCLPDTDLNRLFLAAAEVVEESIYDAMFTATTVTGRGKTIEALPVDRVVEILRRYVPEAHDG